MAELTTEKRKGLEAGEFAFPRLKKLLYIILHIHEMQWLV